MKLLSPSIFEPFPEVVSAMSLRDRDAPQALSMITPQAATDDGPAEQNRSEFANELGFKPDKLAMLKQTHSDVVKRISEPFKGRNAGIEGDALICNEPGWLLAVSVADCVPILVYDPGARAYAAIHSGWRGSAQNITSLAIDALVGQTDSLPRRMYAWIGPAAGAKSYEVGYDVVSQFNPMYSTPTGEDKWLLDNKSIVRDQLLGAGIPEDQLEISTLDTITNQELHSARRDGEESGRMLAAVGLNGA